MVCESPRYGRQTVLGKWTLKKGQHVSDVTSSPINEKEPSESQVAFGRGLAIVLGGVFLYALIHVGIRLIKSDVLGEDDVIANVLSQHLAFGYDTHPRQPPLYNWLLWWVQQGLGPTLESFLLIKYGALIATVGFLYAAAYRVLGSHIYAALSVEALALIYSISWRFHEGFTHQVLAMLAVAVTLFVFLRLVDTAKISNFVLLGIIVGLGLLTERVYLVFVVSLLLATLLQPTLRKKVFRWQIIVSLALAAAVVSPYVFWVLSEPGRLADWFRPGATDQKMLLRGLIDTVRGPWFYLSPLIIFLPLLFRGFVKTAFTKMSMPINRSQEPDLVQLILHAGLVGYILAIVGSLVLQLGKQPVHAFMPLNLASVIWLFAVVRDGTTSARDLKRFAYFALVIACVALTARLANLYVMDPACKKCRWGIPYAELAQQLKAAGVGDHKFVLADRELAGNLRQLFPASQIVLLGTPQYAAPGVDATEGRRVYVWRKSFGAAAAKAYLKPTFPAGVGLASAVELTVPWQHMWRPTGYRKTHWNMLKVDE